MGNKAVHEGKFENEVGNEGNESVTVRQKQEQFFSYFKSLYSPVSPRMA